MIESPIETTERLFMREVGTIKQEMVNTELHLESLKSELRNATAIAYGCIVTAVKAVVIPISTEIATPCPPFGTFTCRFEPDGIFFHDPNMWPGNIHSDAARFVIDGPPETCLEPYDDGANAPFPTVCPCTVAVFRKKDEAEAWTAEHKNDFAEQTTDHRF